MKYTLLQLTQNILASMDSDQVSSISDTAESDQVSQIIRTTYYNIITRANLPEHEQMFTLTGSADTSTPVLMTRPDTVRKIEWIKYLNEDPDINQYLYVTILPFQQFKDMVDQFNDLETGYDSMSFLGQEFRFRTNLQPTYCTIINNNYVVFDSYDTVYDTSLYMDDTKTMCWGQVIPTFTMSDSFIPDMDDHMFPLLLNEAKAQAFLELKQLPNADAAQQSKRLWNILNNQKALADKPSDFDSLAYFGRK